MKLIVELVGAACTGAAIDAVPRMATTGINIAWNVRFMNTLA